VWRPGIPEFTFARSTDNYVIWCVKGNHVYLPGDVTPKVPYDDLKPYRICMSVGDNGD
jgi:hypothetical protein